MQVVDLIKLSTFGTVQNDELLVQIPGNVGHGFLVGTKHNAIARHLSIGFALFAIDDQSGGRFGAVG